MLNLCQTFHHFNAQRHELIQVIRNTFLAVETCTINAFFGSKSKAFSYSCDVWLVVVLKATGPFLEDGFYNVSLVIDDI